MNYIHYLPKVIYFICIVILIYKVIKDEKEAIENDAFSEPYDKYKLLDFKGRMHIEKTDKINKMILFRMEKYYYGLFHRKIWVDSSQLSEDFARYASPSTYIRIRKEKGKLRIYLIDHGNIEFDIRQPFDF